MIVIEDELKENVVHITGTRRFILFTFFHSIQCLVPSDCRFRFGKIYPQRQTGGVQDIQVLQLNSNG